MTAARLSSARARRWLLLVCAVLLVATGIIVATLPGARTTEAEPVTITVPGGPGVAGEVSLDAALYLPEALPAPAVIVAHGFGGNHFSVADEAQRWAREGFAVLAYSARGFGASTGYIHIDSLDHEVADGRALVDWLAQRPEVLLDGPGDPRVGVTGGSYGGALALMLAGTDTRVDAVVAAMTWNDLEQALFPNYADESMTPSPAGTNTPAAVAPGGDGVFQQSWTAALMSSVMTASASPSPSPASPAPGAPECGRLAPDWCAAYIDAAASGRLSPAMSALLATSSPAAVSSDITAPTLLLQGESDTLFGLDQADANARAIAAAGTPVALSWYPGGHSGGPIDAASTQRATDWFAHYLAGQGPEPSTEFRYAVPAATVAAARNARTRWMAAPGYPGLDGQAPVPIRHWDLIGQAQTVLHPPGGLPAAVSSVPGAGTVSAALGGLAALPGQTATFRTASLAEAVVLTGSATVEIEVAALTPGGGDAVLYASLAAVPSADRPAADPEGDGAQSNDDGDASAQALLGALASGPASGAVAPLRIGEMPDDGTPVRLRVQLPAVALSVPEGGAIEVRITTTDQSYAGDDAPAAYRIGLADPVLAAPVTDGHRMSAGDEPIGWAIGIALLLAAGAIGLWRAGRARPGAASSRSAPGPDRTSGPDRASAPDHPDDPDAPALEIRSLRKEYPGGVVAVDNVSFTVPRGAVLGLLGPNGAGKTTTLRMVMGLIEPTAGTVSLFGRPLKPDAPELSRIGSFVEGAGFLPHLSGRANLDLYWRATGRPRADAHLDEVLQIADLGGAVERRVKTYSQGMRQRLAIAQAMLGLPDLLILDEPTNGLDPPQIHAMREVLRRYAATGRTVLVSSHLLSEVEQSCTDVVIVQRGRTIAAGSVTEMVTAADEVRVVTTDPRAAAVLRALDGVAAVEIDDDGVRVRLGSAQMGDVVAALGAQRIPVSAITTRNRLEDVFLDLVGATS